MDQVEEIRNKIDIVALLAEFVTLKKAGRNFKALCPFHTEKSPSFVISPERQIWHCFGGCNKGGDAYQFIMDYEKVDFPEALRVLAKRAGVELKNREFSSGETSQKERLYRINQAAKEYYHYVLTRHKAGDKALQYLQDRGIDIKVTETFSLGFAPGTGDSLVKYLIEKKKFTRNDVIDSGLSFFRGKTLADFFRGRIIFPLVDHRDNVVGFAGRVLNNEDSMAKYINTRETLVYHKGNHIFGLNITKDAIRRENQAIIVEGEFDVLSCFQNGIGNVIAVKGTAFTDEQVSLLARFTDKLVFCFDSDNAGKEAIKRSLPVVEKHGLTPKIVKIPGGKDPDEALKVDSGQFRKAIKNDLPVYDYLIDQALLENDIKSADGKKKFAMETIPFVVQIANEIVKEHYFKKIASAMSITYESVLKEAERSIRKQPSRLVEKPTSPKRSREVILEEYLLALIVQSKDPKHSVKRAIEIFAGSMSRDRAYHKIMDHLLSHFEKEDNFDGFKFANKLPQELVSVFDTSVLFPLPEYLDEEKLNSEIEKIAVKLKEIYIQEKMKKLAVSIKQQEEEGKDVKELQKKYSDLAFQLKAL